MAEPNLARARQMMSDRGVDALVATTARNVHYLSGLDSDWLFDVPMVAAAILPVDPSRPATLIVHDVEVMSLAEKPSWMPELRVYRAHVCGESISHYAVADSPLDSREQAVVALLEKTDPTAVDGLVPAIALALGDMGLDRGQVVCDEAPLNTLLADRLHDLTCAVEPALFRTIRMVKTPFETDLMRAAAQHNHAALADVLGMIGDGVRWADVERAYAVAVARRGGRIASFYVGAGRRSSGLQAHGNYEIRTDDQICFDAMMTWNRYHADMQRTAVLGTPSAKLDRYWTAVSRGQAAAYGAMGPGVRTAELRRIAVDIIRGAGIPGFRHAFVHGLGLDHIELPTDGGGFPDFELEPGMIVNMDLEVCEIGFGGVYFEDSMVITGTGAEALVPSTPQLIHLQ